MLDLLSYWRYTDAVPEARRATLASPGSFDALVALVKDEACEIHVRACAGRDPGLTDCIQPIFSIKLQTTGDPLFNGPWGYRAQYWLSPSTGLAANAALLTALTPKLLACVDTMIVPELAKINVCTSLRGSSAKIWIKEILTLLHDPTADLEIERWRVAADRGVELAKWGRSAPEVTEFEIKGALLDPYGNEVIPCRKINRHFEIHNYGFS